MEKAATAIMDASIIYGASRYLNRLHDDTNWKFRHEYKKIEDQALFYEFLHDLLLYDEILLDNSSVTIIAEEIKTLMDMINRTQAKSLISTRHLADIGNLEPVILAVCKIINQLRNKHDFQEIQVPWVYRSGNHHDFSIFSRFVSEYAMDRNLIPYALFAFRGICYAGFSHGFAEYNHKPSTYLASPGRLAILKKILSDKDIREYDYPKRAYYDLIEKLRLPDNGYKFTSLNNTFMAHELSALTFYLYQSEPKDALQKVLQLRNSDETKKMRELWYERLCEYSQSSAIGVNINQNISNANIHGNVNMYIHASAL